MAITAYEEIRDLKKTLAEKIAAVGQDAIKAEFVKFFENNLQITAIRWTQFTPYFNDGDPCVFSVNDYDVKLTLLSDADGEEPIDKYDREDRESEAGKQVEALYEVALKFFQTVNDDDVFLSVFGDHAEVTATSAGFKVDECQHD